MAGPIIRRPDRVAGELTAEERVRLAAHTAQWIAIAMRTDPCDPIELTRAIQDLYRVSGLAAPRVVIVPSPLVMALAGGIASAWWRMQAEIATRAATYDATDAATYAATAVATRAATATATSTATSAAIDAATSIATAVATDAATFAATREWLGPLIERWVGYPWFEETQVEIRMWPRRYQGGNMWASWECYLTAMRDVLGLRLPEHRAYDAWERAARHGGFRYLHPQFCLVSDFPSILSIDDRHRPHSDHGPSHQWRDGWALWHWHGVRVDQYVIEQPERITVADITTETNAEVRRVKIERMGYARYLAEVRATVVDELPADYPVKGLRSARLLQVASDPEPLVLLECLNATLEPDGTQKRYLLSIDPHAYDGQAAHNCHAAMASTWRRANGSLYFERPEHYAPTIET